MLDKYFSRQHIEMFFLFSQKIGFNISVVSVKPYFPGKVKKKKKKKKKKKIINLSSAEFAQRTQKVHSLLQRKKKILKIF